MGDSRLPDRSSVPEHAVADPRVPPGRARVGRPERWYSDPGYPIPVHGSDPYTKPVIVLAEPATYSRAEDFAVVFDAMKRGRIVGEATGGSTGQPLSIPLPGGGSLRICTKHDRYPDGKEFVGVGVLPGIVVLADGRGFPGGRDTVLEAAVRLLAKP